MRAGPGVPVGGDTCLGGAVGGRGVKAGAASGKAFSCPPAPEPFLGKLLRLVKATGPRGERQQRPRGLWRARRPEADTPGEHKPCLKNRRENQLQKVMKSHVQLKIRNWNWKLP